MAEASQSKAVQNKPMPTEIKERSSEPEGKILPKGNDSKLHTEDVQSIARSIGGTNQISASEGHEAQLSNAREVLPAKLAADVNAGPVGPAKAQPQLPAKTGLKANLESTAGSSYGRAMDVLSKAADSTLGKLQSQVASATNVPAEVTKSVSRIFPKSRGTALSVAPAAVLSASNSADENAGENKKKNFEKEQEREQEMIQEVKSTKPRPASASLSSRSSSRKPVTDSNRSNSNSKDSSSSTGFAVNPPKQRSSLETFNRIGKIVQKSLLLGNNESLVDKSANSNKAEKNPKGPKSANAVSRPTEKNNIDIEKPWRKSRENSVSPSRAVDAGQYGIEDEVVTSGDDVDMDVDMDDDQEELTEVVPTQSTGIVTKTVKALRGGQVTASAGSDSYDELVR